MQLTVRNVSEMLKVSEATVRRWVVQRGLPAQRVAGQFRFNRVEVFDWALAHQIKVESVRKFETGQHTGDQQADSQPCVSLADALEAGGVHYKISGDQQEAALRAVVWHLPLPEDFDRE